MTTENKSTKNNYNRSTKLARISYAFFAISTYIYASGALFFYGLMEELGFAGASLDSMFSPLVYSQYYIANIFSKAIILQGVDLLLFPLKNTFMLALLILFALVLIKLGIVESAFNKSTFSLNKESMTDKPVKTSLVAFFGLYFSQLLAFASFIALLSFIALPIILPYSMGVQEAQKRIEHNNGTVCKEFNWSSDEYKDKNIILSCSRIRINKDGETISGSIIHSDQKFYYVLANHLLLRMKDGQILSCVTKQYNSMHVNDDENNAKDSTDQTKESTELKTCEDLYIKTK